jgi:hypothetical protein
MLLERFRKQKSDSQQHFIPSFQIQFQSLKSHHQTGRSNSSLRFDSKVECEFPKVADCDYAKNWSKSSLVRRWLRHGFHIPSLNCASANSSDQYGLK